MIQKQYNSFEEIDMQLKILKLKRALEKEKLIFNYLKVKYLLYPKNIALEFGNIIHQNIIAFILNRYYWMF